MKFTAVVFFLFIYGFGFTQFKFDFNDSINVKFGNQDLQFPWAGGLNYAQFSEIDFDFDGDNDLFIFDKSKDNIRLFENVLENGVRKYKVVRLAQNYFPSDLKYRVALLDYDLDGKNDIFTYGIGGVKVYQNIGNAVDGLKWKLVSDLLYSDYNGSNLNLYVSSADIPAYVDVDKDGDIDVLTFDLSGERVEYHQNQSQELYGHSDSLIFKLKNACWGKFTEDAISSQITLNATNTPCNSGNVPNPQLSKNDSLLIDKNHKRHSGSTLLALDYDNSGVLDLVIGDVSLNSLILLINGGSAVNTNSPMVSMESNFPSNTTPVNLSIFPAAFYLDVDFDNIKDLIVTPNARNVSQNEKSVYFYKNLGTNSKPNFTFRTQAFLQENMIENGVGAIPVFVDEDGDGKQDLLVSNFYRYLDFNSRECGIQNFRNSGTQTNPSFSFIEADFLALKASNLGLRLVPTFGDIDGDGDQDMFLGLENGTISYYENNAGAGNQLQFANPIHNFQDQSGNVITAQSYAFPQLFDLNKDGLLDLIIGKKTGELLYYENTGTASLPSFFMKNDLLGGIDLATSSPDGYAAPHFFKHADTIKLILGSYDGKLRFYDSIEGKLEQGSNFRLLNDYFSGVSVEAYSSAWINDIDNDGNFDLFIGGDLGGIYRLEHNLNSSLSVDEINNYDFLKIYPNPTKNVIYIENNSSQDNFSVEIFTSIGEQVAVFRLERGMKKTINSLAQGVYFVHFKSNTKPLSTTKKVIVLGE